MILEAVVLSFVTPKAVGFAGAGVTALGGAAYWAYNNYWRNKKPDEQFDAVLKQSTQTIQQTNEQLTKKATEVSQSTDTLKTEMETLNQQVTALNETISLLKKQANQQLLEKNQLVHTIEGQSASLATLSQGLADKEEQLNQQLQALEVALHQSSSLTQQLEASLQELVLCKEALLTTQPEPNAWQALHEENQALKQSNTALAEKLSLTRDELAKTLCLVKQLLLHESNLPVEQPVNPLVSAPDDRHNTTFFRHRAGFSANLEG